MDLPIVLEQLVYIPVLIGGSLVYRQYASQNHEIALSTFLITSGVELIISAFGKLDDKVIALFTKQPLETNYVQLGIGVVLLAVGIWFLRYVQKKLYILNINGYYDRRIEHHQSDLKLSAFAFKEREIDFIRLFNKGMTKEIANEIREEIEQKIKSYIEESKDKKRGYTGIAPIPFIMLAGKAFTRHSMNEYFEFNKLNNRYYQLTGRKLGFINRRYPELVQSPSLSSLQAAHAEEVVIAISVTSRISDADTSQFSFPVIHLAIPQPQDNAIQSKDQLMDYCTKIHDLLNELHQRFPRLKKIHLLISAQSCLAFELGKLIDDNRMAMVISYHYSRQHTPKYPWGIVMNGAQKGTFIEVKLRSTK